ncbi:sigma 54-interacting transcriptional regulator [bacterium]|nr:sigma 54-interacting transcriptional regulator [bacterium]
MNARYSVPLIRAGGFSFVSSACIRLRICRLSVLVLLLAPLCILGQAADAGLPLRFDHITVEDGLSQSVVSTIFQDSKGFIWFGTEDGLNRYDGYEFTIFYSNPDDSASLSINSITAMDEDCCGNIWVGTREGLNVYDPRTETFTRFFHSDRDSFSISDDHIRVILCAGDSTLWIGTQRGLNRVNRNALVSGDYRFERFITEGEDGRGAGVITVLFENSRGSVWVNDVRRGLLELTGDEEEHPLFTPLFPSADVTVPAMITDICEDRNGAFWLGSRSTGLYRLRIGDHPLVELFSTATCPSLTDDAIRAVHADTQGNLWVATQYGGLNRLDVSELESGHPQFTSYNNDPDNPGSISTTDILSIYEDRSGVLWFGTFGAAVNKLNPLQNFFFRFRNTADEAVSREHQRIWALIEDHEGVVWLGTDGGGAYRYDRARNRFSPFRLPDIDPAFPVLKYVACIFEDSRHDLWFGTFGQGLFRYQRPAGANMSGVLTRLLSDMTVSCLHEDRNGDLWIGTAAGLHCWSAAAGTVDVYRHRSDDASSISSNRISALAADTLGNLWIGTVGGGLCVLRGDDLEADTPEFHCLRHDRGNDNSPGADYIRALAIDSRGKIWIGTQGRGVSSYDPGDGTFVHYTTEQGLSNNTVVGVLEDNQGNIWCSTLKGLSKIVVHTGTITNYFISDGLQNNEFLSGAYFKNSQGELFFGGISGFNIFTPEQMKINPYPPQVVITDLQVYNRSVTPGRRPYGAVPAASAITYADEVILSYEENTLTFEFAALHFAVPEKNSYAYRMNGIERDWNVVNDRRFVTYSRLRPGRYTFEVKAANNDGLWNDTGASIRIRIIPPFWMTGMFRVSAVLLAGLLLLAAVRKELREMRAKRAALEERVREKTAAADELKSALDEVERLKNRLEAENTYLQDEIKLDHNFANIITRNRRMRHIMGQIEKVSGTDSTVLILGESGTGKELVARAIHGISLRKDRPLMKVDCASLPPSLIESELFGHEKGAFTGAHTKKIGRIELADGGTVFLDEIGEVPAPLQAKLLRFLQDGIIERIGNPRPIAVDVRIMAATNRDLQSMIRNGSFREDLYYRLNVFPIDIPPLRERREDIPLLVQHFCEKYSGKFSKQITHIPKSVADRLGEYSWPGNIRELENVIERAVILSPGSRLVVGDWLLHDAPSAGTDEIIPMEEMEKAYITRVLERTGWRVSGERGAARLLGMKPTTLESRMKKLGIERK